MLIVEVFYCLLRSCKGVKKFRIEKLFLSVQKLIVILQTDFTEEITKRYASVCEWKCRKLP